MDLGQIEELIELMRRSGVVELSLERPDCKIHLRRGSSTALGASSLQAATEGAGPAAGEGEAPGPPASPPPAMESVRVTSPVVGVFRSAGERGTSAVGVGDPVTRGMLLGTVESMKVPNQVRSPADGAVVDVLAEEGQPVEFGQVLFTIRPEEGGETDENETAV